MSMPANEGDMMLLSCLVTDDAFELEVVKCAIESNNIYP